MTESASAETAQGRIGRVEFTGSRYELLGIILRGYLLMIPTIGLYRFWQATWKRRFFWQNTVIDGDPIEYTGRATQLLIGFLFALAFFLPVYIALFYLSMQDTDLVLIGYGIIAAVIWFLSGYGIYRARDFRLSRTLWRGIRFDQQGSAWGYALRRFVWSILMVCTLGLIYPWMSSGLWRYRYRHTWYGDRKFEINGNWRIFAGPFYGAFLVNILAIGFTIGWITSTQDFVRIDNNVAVLGPIGFTLCGLCALVFGLSLAWYRTRTVSRMLSTVSVGAATLNIRIRTWPLVLQYVLYGLGVAALLIVIGLTALLTIGGIYASAAAQGDVPDISVLLSAFQSGTLNVVLLIMVYLVILGAFGALSELVLGCGWWSLLARNATIGNVETLRSVRAIPEDQALVGQGLADALNVGAY